MMDTPTERMKQTVTLISVTPDAEKHMAYCARVSNPNNQENEKFSGLLKYCVKHQHWSIFEQAWNDNISQTGLESVKTCNGTELRRKVYIDLTGVMHTLDKELNYHKGVHPDT